VLIRAFAARAAAYRARSLCAGARHGHERKRHGSYQRLHIVQRGHVDYRRVLRHRQAPGHRRHRRPTRGDGQRRGSNDRPACQAPESRSSKLRVAVQGFGKCRSVGPWRSPSAGPRSWRSPTSSRGMFSQDGLDMQKLAAHAAKTGSVKGFAGGEDVPLDAVLEADCDRADSRGGGSAVTDKNAGRIRARLIAKGECSADAGGRRNSSTLAASSSSPTFSAMPAASSSPISNTPRRTQARPDDPRQVDERLTQRMTTTFEQVYEDAAKPADRCAPRRGYRREPIGRRHRCRGLLP